MCVCQKSGAHAFGSVRDTRDTHGGENVDTPIGQCVLIGNFRYLYSGELVPSATVWHRFQFSTPHVWPRASPG